MTLKILYCNKCHDSVDSLVVYKKVALYLQNESHSWIDTHITYVKKYRICPVCFSDLHDEYLEDKNNKLFKEYKDRFSNHEKVFDMKEINAETKQEYYKLLLRVLNKYRVDSDKYAKWIQPSNIFEKYGIKSEYPIVIANRDNRRVSSDLNDLKEHYFSNVDCEIKDVFMLDCYEMFGTEQTPLTKDELLSIVIDCLTDDDEFNKLAHDIIVRLAEDLCRIEYNSGWVKCLVIYGDE